MKKPMLLSNDEYDLSKLDYNNQYFSIKRDGIRSFITIKGLKGRSLKTFRNTKLQTFKNKRIKGQKMNREIKFRGQRIHNKEFIYGDLAQLGNKKWIFKVKLSSYILEGHKDFIEIIPETVGQFTGLKDKNGKEIYEGDIGVVEEW